MWPIHDPTLQETCKFNSQSDRCQCLGLCSNIIDFHFHERPQVRSRQPKNYHLLKLPTLACWTLWRSLDILHWTWVRLPGDGVNADLHGSRTHSWFAISSNFHCWYDPSFAKQRIVWHSLWIQAQKSQTEIKTQTRAQIGTKQKKLHVRERSALKNLVFGRSKLIPVPSSPMWFPFGWGICP